MKHLFLFEVLLAASVVSAAPSPADRSLNGKAIESGEPSHHARPVRASTTYHGEDALQHDHYYNWAGGIQKATGSDVFTAVHAQFAVPTASVPRHVSKVKYYGYSMVNIDGTAGFESSLQAGVRWIVDNTHSGAPKTTYNLFYEWVPNGLRDITDFEVKPGDVISVDINANNPTHGLLTWKNTRTQKTKSGSVSAPNPNAKLHGKTAEWIVSDPYSAGTNSTQLPLAAFGTVKFKSCELRTAKGGLFSPGNSNLADMVNHVGNVIVKATRVSRSEIDVHYIG